IETPLSLPDDIKKKLNLESRDRGRIWRISYVGKDAKPPAPVRPKLSSASTETLVGHLENANSWWRLTAQRLLIEKQDKSAPALVEKLLGSTKSPVGKMHTLWTLEGL